MVKHWTLTPKHGLRQKTNQNRLIILGGHNAFVIAPLLNTIRSHSTWISRSFMKVRGLARLSSTLTQFDIRVQPIGSL